MRKGRFSEEQMVAIIREADRDPVAAVAKRHGISEQTIYTWRKRFGGLQARDVKRLRQLEAENGRLKKLVAERDPPPLTQRRSQPSDGRITQNRTPLLGPTCLGAQTWAPPSGATTLLILSLGTGTHSPSTLTS